MNQVIEQLHQTVSELPEHEAKDVLDFALFLHSKSSQYSIGTQVKLEGLISTENEISENEIRDARKTLWKKFED